MGTYTDIHSKRVAFTQGEALDGTDLTAMQTRAVMQGLQNLIMSGVADGIGDVGSLGGVDDIESGKLWNTAALDDISDLVFAPYPSCGYVAPGGSARQLVIVDGPAVLVYSDDPLGASNVENVRAFRLTAAGAGTLTTAVGDATNPRIDLVEVRALWTDADATVRNFEDETSRALTSSSTNKSRALSVTVQIKQGTPAATPTYPTPSSGFVALAAVYVPATHNAVHDPANLRDLRMPLGKVVAYDVYAHQMRRTTLGGGTNAWTLGDDDFRVEAPSDPCEVYALCPVGSQTGRLIGLGMFGAVDGADCFLVDLDTGFIVGTNIANLTEDFPLLDATGAFRRKNMIELMANLAVEGAYPGLRATGTRIGTPIWCNGFPAGPAMGAGPLSGGAQTVHTLAVKFNGDPGGTVSMVRFYVAQGL